MKKTDCIALLSVGAVIVIFFLPLLLGEKRFFFDDIAFLFYPQQVYLSNCLKQGVMPAWDPHICAGATPFYTRIFASHLYPLNWLFLLVAPGGAQAASFFWLVKAPLFLHYLFCGLFSFWFARSGLRLNRPASLVLALSYTFSPTLIYMSTYPPEVFIQSWLPLFCLCLLAYYRGEGLKWIIGGAILFGIVSPSGDVPFTFHLVMITSLFGLGLVILSMVRREWKKAVRVVGAVIAIFGLGVLLAGYYWSSIMEGIVNTTRVAGIEMQQLSGPGQSLFPVYMVTLFIPNFFGGVVNQHNWGAAFQIKCSLNDAQLSGGVVGFYIIFLGLLSVLKFKNRLGGGKDAQKSFWWIFFGLFILSLFIVMGAYTPVLEILRVFIPFLKMPYPIRFRSLECFAFSGLLGLSINLLWNYWKPRAYRPLSFYLITLVLIIFIALSFPYRIGNRIFSPGWRHLTYFQDWSWFITEPLIYFATAAALLFLISFFRRRRLASSLLVLILIGELIVFAYGAFYQNRILNHRHHCFSVERYFGPSDHPVYNRILGWKPEAPGEEKNFRRLYYRSYFDNLAWINDTYSSLGVDIKPIDQRFQALIGDLTVGFPYEIMVKKPESRFWRNMSAAYLLAPPNFVRSDSLPVQEKTGDLISYHLPDALPRIYFQDNWVSASEAEARRAILEYDLRQVGYCDKDTWKFRPSSLKHQIPDSDLAGENQDHFSDLQAANRIEKLDLSLSDKIEMEIDVARDCMLVMTDLWHPEWYLAVDGKKETIHRVNYLQRGVWCTPGKHHLILEFRPAARRRGLWLTGFGVVIVMILLIWKLKKGNPAGGMQGRDYNG